MIDLSKPSVIKSVFEVEDGFILVPEEARAEISFLLRRYEEVLYTIVGEAGLEKQRAQSVAYCFEQAKEKDKK